MKKIIEIEFSDNNKLNEFINIIKQNNELFKGIYVKRIYSPQCTLEDLLNRTISN